MVSAPAASAVEATPNAVAIGESTMPTAGSSSTPTVEPTTTATGDPTPTPTPTPTPPPTAEAPAIPVTDCGRPVQTGGEFTASVVPGSNRLVVTLPAIADRGCFDSAYLAVAAYDTESAWSDVRTVEIPSEGSSEGAVEFALPAADVEYNVVVNSYGRSAGGDTGPFEEYSDSVYAAASLVQACAHENGGIIVGGLDANAEGGAGHITVTVNPAALVDCIDSGKISIRAVPHLDDADDSWNTELFTSDLDHQRRGGLNTTAIRAGSYWILADVTAEVDGHSETFSSYVGDERIIVTAPSTGSEAAGGSNGGGALASTGVESTVPIALGSALLAAGLLGLLVARRRRA